MKTLLNRILSSLLPTKTNQIKQICPFIENNYYRELEKLGWTYDEGTGGLHIIILQADSDGVGFDAYPIEEREDIIELHFSEFDFSHLTDFFNNQNYKPSIIRKSELSEIIKPYLARGFEWREEDEVEAPIIAPLAALSIL